MASTASPTLRQGRLCARLHPMEPGSLPRVVVLLLEHECSSDSCCSSYKRGRTQWVPLVSHRSLASAPATPPAGRVNPASPKYCNIFQFLNISTYLYRQKKYVFYLVYRLIASVLNIIQFSQRASLVKFECWKCGTHFEQTFVADESN